MFWIEGQNWSFQAEGQCGHPQTKDHEGSIKAYGVDMFAPNPRSRWINLD